MGLVKRYLILTAVGAVLAGCLSAGTFFYVYVPAEQAFSPARLSSGKVVGRSESRLFFGRFASVSVWDFEAGRVKEYFVPVEEYARLREGDVIGFRYRGHFIVVVQRVERLE